MVLGSCAALGVFIHLVHGFQVKRNARALLEQATVAEQEGRPEQAAEHLALYLGMAPHDTEALARYALLLHRLAREPKARLKAFFTLERALRQLPRADLRRQAATAALDLGRFSDARAHLELLLKDSPADAELLRLQGRCEAGTHAFNKAAATFARALVLAPADSDLAIEYADLLRDSLRRPEAADAVLEKMVRANPRAPQTRLAAARSWYRAGAPDRAGEHVRFALDELSCRDADLLLLAADVALARGKPDEARTHLRDGRKRYPHDPRMIQGLARLALHGGQQREALDHLKPLIKELPHRPEELWDLANMLIDAGEPDEARRVMQHLNGRSTDPAIACLQARLAMQRRAYGAALTLLEKVRPAARKAPEMDRHLNCLLAECHERLGNPDQQLAACRRALESDASCLPARRGAAAALLALGKLDQAIEEIRRLAVRAPEMRVELARLLLARNLRLPAGERDWDAVEEVLKTQPPALAPPFTAGAADAVELLRAEILTARGQLAAARKVAERVRDRDPKKPAPWLLLLALAERSQTEFGNEEATAEGILNLLNEAERKTGRRVEWPLTRLRHAVRAARPDSIKTVVKVEESLRDFPAADADRLLRSLAEAALALGDRARAERLWRQLAERRPEDLPVRFRLFESALQAGKEEEARRILDEVRNLEGDNGPLAAFGEAACLALRARRGDRAAVTEARLRLAAAAALRPSWSRVPLLEADLYEREGNKTKALERYQAALDRGESRPVVLRRVLELLHAQGHYAEASALVRRLPEQALASPALGRLAVEAELIAPTSPGANPVALRRHALERARQAVVKDSADYRDHLWLGQVAATAGEPAEAEKALRKARGLAEDAPDAWAALILFLARTDAPKAEMELAAARDKLPRDKLPLVLAPACEALGKLEQAEKQFRILADRANAPTALKNLASFYLRTGQQARAEPILRKVLAPETKATVETVRWGRRALAVALAFRGGYPPFREASTLLDENAKGGVEEVDDRRARALVLATQPSHRREAIRLFESLSSRRGDSRADFQFLLARLYEADGDWRKARGRLLSVLASHDKNPVYLAHYIHALLRHKQGEEAAGWVDRFAALGRPALETLELRARVAHASGKTAEAVRLIEEYVAEKASRLDAAARLLEQIGQAERAEPLYRELAARSKDPRNSLLFARHLARRGRLADALDLCEAAWKTCPPELVARVSVDALRGGKASPAQEERVERWLAEARRKDAKSLVLRLLLAEVQERRGRHDEAVAHYRKVLAQEPRNVIALNNLAFQLALRWDNSAKALSLIEEAVKEAGPQAELLDTRAVVYLTQGKADLAIEDLKRALAEAPSAGRYAHLAQAHQLKRDRLAARVAYRKACDLGLSEARVHPLERSQLRQLSARMK